ncbi:MAG: ROK family protein [Mucinivorans sp.]
MFYTNDKRIVMILDAGRSNFVFTALQGGKPIVEPIKLSSCPKSLDECMNNLIIGFQQVSNQLTQEPAAISFAFPGPADYPKGIMGNIPNFPSFQGGMALGDFLKDNFHIPIFINNDGDMFAYGEALTGVLPEVNERLSKFGNTKTYHNLLGITIGTGFGAGVVINGELLIGDNGVGGDLWCMRNKKYQDSMVEDSVSIRAIKRVYAELSGDTLFEYTPKEIYQIACGETPGDTKAAIATFEELGQIAGEAIASAITVIDGLIVIGGGISGANEFIIPAIIKELSSELTINGEHHRPRLQMQVYNLDTPDGFREFATPGPFIDVPIYGTSRSVSYDPQKRIGIISTHQGSTLSRTMGAYAYALEHTPTM